MGNCKSQQEDTKWKFVGRGADLKKITKLLSKKRSVLVFGMKKIGKSRVMEVICRQLCVRESTQCVWKDFELDDIKSDHTVYDWFIEFLTSIDATEEKRRFENKYPSKSFAGSSCEKCKPSERDNCLNRNHQIEPAINNLISCLKKCEKKIVLFLDNIDRIMDSTLKESFLYFLSKSLECSNLQTLLASANKPKQTSQVYETLELKPLESGAILELLFETTEKRDDSSDKEEGCDKTVTYSLEFKVFTPENWPYIQAIVGLCEGLPLAAAMSGLLLTEDDGLLTPEDLVEILIRIRLQGLSPDNCPPDDRLDIYKDQMEKLKDIGPFFDCLNENMTGSQFSVNEAVDAAGAAGHDAVTGAMVKHNILKKGLDRSALSVQTQSGVQQLKWHGILRECQAALKAKENDRSGLDIAKKMVWKFMKENARNAGLDFDEEILRDPKSLEHAIKRLSQKKETPSPVQAKQDSGKGRLSLSEEDRLASKKTAITEFTTEQSAIMKVHNEVEPSRAVQNNPPNDSRTAKTHAIRYSSDSDSENLQFIRQTEGSMMNDVHKIPQAEKATPCRQSSYGNQSLRRARSDPTNNRSDNNLSRHQGETTRREMDTSVNYSLNGPPAMNYMPPSIEIQGNDYFPQPDFHHAVQHTDRSMQATSHRIAELKEQFPATLDRAFVQSGFSSQGPADMSYKMSLNNDLQVDQDNFDQISLLTPAQSKSTDNKIAQNGELSQVQRQFFGNSLDINPNRHETNVIRRSPTAIVRPMPYVDKQPERRNRNARSSNNV